MTDRPLRSLLYLPASNLRALEKARTLPAHAVLLDLEDAVAPDQKTTARAQMVEALQGDGFGERRVVVRVNGLDTPWGQEDLAAVGEARPDAVLVPKIDDAAALAPYRDALTTTGPLLWAMVETGKAVLNLNALAMAAPGLGLKAFVLGANDLAKETRMRPDAERTPLHFAMSATVTAAHAWGLAAYDAVYNAFQDPEGFEAECLQAKAFGFDGKSLIHPSQVEPCNRLFAPDADETAWAQAVVLAFDDPANAAKGAVQVEGRMVERLHLEEARRTLAGL